MLMNGRESDILFGRGASNKLTSRRRSDVFAEFGHPPNRFFLGLRNGQKRRLVTNLDDAFGTQLIASDQNRPVFNMTWWRLFCGAVYTISPSPIMYTSRHWPLRAENVCYKLHMGLCWNWAQWQALFVSNNNKYRVLVVVIAPCGPPPTPRALCRRHPRWSVSGAAALRPMGPPWPREPFAPCLFLNTCRHGRRKKWAICKRAVTTIVLCTSTTKKWSKR